MLDLGQIQQKFSHHFAGVGQCILGIGDSLHHNQLPLGSVVKGAFNFQS